jgi:hypothetical protein
MTTQGDSLGVYDFGDAIIEGEQEIPEVIFDDPSPETVFAQEAFSPQPDADPGNIVDSNLPRADPEKPTKTVAKSGPPLLDDWMDFFSRVVFRTFSDFYVDFSFRGIDEDSVSPADVEKLKLTQEERQEIAAPLASYANKSKFMRKHGRMIIAGADSIDALIILGMWMARVNRVAAKYRPAKAKKVRNGTVPPGAASGSNGSGEYVPDDRIRVFNPGTG